MVGNPGYRTDRTSLRSLQPVGQLQGGFRLFADPQIERFQSSRDQKTAERIQYRAGRVLNEIQLVEQRLSPTANVPPRQSL